jgi:MFS superfamily sulfate permease-like transporter
VLLGIAAVAALDLDVDIVGHIDGGLPAFGLPDVSLHDFGALASGGVAVMLVGFAEGLGAAKTYAAREHYEIDTNRELLGLGGANLAAGLSSGMVVNGSLSKTAVNGGAGAHTQLSGLIVAALTVVTLLVLTGLFEQLPEATLAAVVIAAVIELVDVRALGTLYRDTTRGFDRVAARPDFIAAVAALLGVLVFDTLPGLFIGISMSLLLLVYRASRPYIATLGRMPGSAQYADVARHPENRPPDGVAVLRVEGGAYFANADAIRTCILAAAKDARAIVLDAETIPFVDVTAARMLAALAGDLRRDGVELLIARDTGQVRDLLHREAPDPALQRVYPSVQAAVDAARKLQA